MDSYGLLKSLHIVGAILFIRNIIVTGWWKTMADRPRNPIVIAFAQRQVTLTDWVFTAGGVILVLMSGLDNSLLHGIPLATPWTAWGLALFTLSGVVWIAVLVPLQAKLGRLARGFAGGGPITQEYWRLERLWLVWGVIATLLPLAVIPLMVLKPS
jgi:uncharacterized membrane protein